MVTSPIIDTAYKDVEKWACKPPQMGDHIRVMRMGGLYYHHGIYVSDDEVIHFTGQDGDSIFDWSKPEVISSDLAYFVKDGFLEVKEYTDEEFQDLYSPEQIVAYARSCIGSKGYNLFFNNCEHFANYCTLGRFRSRQVENVVKAIPAVEINYINGGNENMGLISWAIDKVRNWVSGGSSSGSSSSGGGSSRSTSATSYEPDKVKVAEIEADTKIKLADMEKERITLMKEAQKELLHLETESKIALEMAKAKGLEAMANTILSMQGQLNRVAEQRLLIIEHGSMEIVKEIENFYEELGRKIEEDDDRYNEEKLPKLLSLLKNYEAGTPEHTLYEKRIQTDMDLQARHYMMQVESLAKRQAQVIESFQQTKDRIIEQTGQMTAGLLETIQNQQLTLNGDTFEGQPLFTPSPERQAITDGSK